MNIASKRLLTIITAVSLLLSLPLAMVSAKSLDTNTRKFTKGDYYSYKYVSEKLQRKILPSQDFAGCNPCSWTSKDARTARNFEPIRVQAFKAIKAFGYRKKVAPIEIEWVISKSAQSSLVKMYKKLNIEAINYWQSELSQPLPYRLLIGTEKDRAEVQTMLSETRNGPSSLQMLNNFFDRYSNMQDYEKARPVGGGMPGRDTLISNGKDVYLVTYHVGSFTTDQKVFMTTSAHEITHVLQIDRSGNVGYNKNMPPTLWEGSAVLFGSGIPMPNVAWYSDELDHQLMRFLSNYAGKVPMVTESDAINLLITAEKTDTDVSIEAGYYVGAILFEWLIAKHGVQKYLDLLDATGSAQSFDDSMMKAYGIGKAEIYTQAAPYVLKSYQRVLKVSNS